MPIVSESSDRNSRLKARNIAGDCKSGRINCSEPTMCSTPMTEDEIRLAQAVREFQTAEMRIRLRGSAERLWSQRLTQSERERLDGELYPLWSKVGTAGIWMRLRGVGRARAVVEVACQIGFLCEEDRDWLLREMGECLSGEEAFEKAIEDGHLVLNEDTHEVFWQGKAIEIDWTHEMKWAFMWEVCRHGKAGRPVDRFTFLRDARPNFVSQSKNTLKKNGLPQELVDSIQTVGNGTQQLMLPPDEIRIFERHIDNEIKEWHP